MKFALSISLLTLIGLLTGINAACAAEQRPNVLVILADDLGYADVG